MRDIVERHRPDLLELACAEAGDDPFERVADGTAYAQPAIYCASLAGWSQLGEPHADFLAGHSLGEFGALVAAGSLTAEDGLRLVALRGRLTQRAGEADPGGGMLAVRAPVERAEALADAAGAVLANDNSPEQVVLFRPRRGARRRRGCGQRRGAPGQAPAGERRLPLSGDAERGPPSSRPRWPRSRSGRRVRRSCRASPRAPSTTSAGGSSRP